MILFLFFFMGCGTIEVKKANPQPNVDLNQMDYTISLEFGKNLKDTYTVPEKRGIRQVLVTEWKSTIKTAFDNTFSDAFKIVDKDGQLKILIKDAYFEFVPGAVTASGGVVSVRPQLKYKVRLLDKDGKTLNKLTGTVQSINALTRIDQTTASAGEVIEILFEKMVKKFFENVDKYNLEKENTAKEEKTQI